jgi:hypothetical protein
MVPQKLTFSPLSRRQIEADFSGGHITSDAGVLLLREVDKQHRLTQRLAETLTDQRDARMIRHGLNTMIRQRVYGVASGYEDLNDHEALRFDQALQTATGNASTLAGKSTLCRMEQAMDRQTIVKAHELLWHHFIPLYVFCGRHLLVSYLRTSNRGDARHSWAILALLVRFIREYWPQTRIVFRGDSHFSKPRLLAWCDRNQVDYIVGMARNQRLEALAAPAMDKVRAYYEAHGHKLASTFRFRYKARSWHKHRWVVARLEYGPQGPNPRFVISSRYDEGFTLYYEQYCARGDMENRIKDQQLDLFADRTSSTHWWTNQWRLILSGFAYTLFERLRVHLKNTHFERMSAGTLRLKLIKVGAVIIRNTRRIRVLMSESYPHKEDLLALVQRLVPS